MPVVLLVVVVAVIALLAAFAPRMFKRVRGKVAARIHLRDGLAWRGDTPPGAHVNMLPPGVWRVTDTPTWDENAGAWQAMIVVDQAGGVAMLGAPVKPGGASYGLVAERVARTLAGSIGITWKNK